MKKLMLALISMSMVGSIGAYEVKIKNHTKESIQVFLTYGGPGICSPDTKSLQAWTTRTVSTGGCCPIDVKIRKTSGTNTDTWYNYYPTRTGFRLSCKSSKVKVTENPDGSLNTESY